MGRRKLKHEELVELAGSGAGGGTALAHRTVDPHALHDTSDVTSLQQTAGNKAATTAVQTLAVQRRDKPASTDAPGAKKGKQPPKQKAPEQVDYAPTEANPKFNGWATNDLLTRGNQEAESTVKNSLYFAAELFEEYWFRTKQRAAGMPLYRVYKKLGDEARSAYWLGVSNGSIVPGKKADEDMSDKAF